MKKFMVMAGLVVVAVACGTGADMVGEILDAGVPDAGAESPGDGTSMQYVGNSEATFSGRNDWYDSGLQVYVQQGRYDHYKACQETFGPGHRTCTADEIVFTTKIPQLSEGDLAWLDPRVEDCVSQSQDRATVDHLGRLARASCPTADEPNRPFLPIACCGPK